MLDFQKMKALREKLDMTQEAAGQAAGLGSRQAWNNIESGRQANISMDLLDRIAKALKCKPKDLLK